MNDKDAYQGTVDEIIYQNEDNGYAIFDLDAGEEGLITCVGTLPFLKRGEMLIVSGTWVNHPSYGQQLKVSLFQRVEPESKDTILTYLSSGVSTIMRKASSPNRSTIFSAVARPMPFTTPDDR